VTASTVQHVKLVLTNGMTYRARGAGPVGGRLVLLLHGFPETSAAWLPTMEALGAAGHRAIAFDQRGYSPEARPEGVEHYTIDALVDDVVAAADALGERQFDLVGHDWGGAIAWHVAGRHPDRVRTLTIASTPHPRAFASALKGELGGDQASKSGYVQFFRSPDAEGFFLDNDAAALKGMYATMPDEAAADYLKVLTEPGALTAALNYYRATSFDDQPECGPITMPTLYVWSTDDMALGREAAEATGSHVEGPYRFEVLDGVSHWIPEDAADTFSKLLLEHLATNP
jgi:pimeloyl-ACP methyl ester carboxylesterase